MKCRIIFSILFMLYAYLIYAQNSAEKIRNNHENTLKEIEYANKLLMETQGKTKESLNELDIINHKLAKRREYLMGLEVEVNVIGDAIDKNKLAIEQIGFEIQKIKRIYGLMVVNLFKKRTKSYQGMYLIASNNLNQFYKRVHIIKLYKSYLKKQRSKLESLANDLKMKNEELNKLKGAKDNVLTKTKGETLTIQQELNEKNKVVKQLKQKQKQIEEDIRNKERIAKKLENELRKIIDAERRRSKNTKEVATPAEKIISNDFEKNSGKLPWPTQRGIITGKYGEHKHPDYKNVIIRNDGVYISTAAGENARTIFKGVVSRVFSIPGENFTVIVKHGQYFTLYHNLINVIVKPGQAVNTKDVLGTVFTESNKKETILYFQIWKEMEKRDPELWLAPM